MFAHRHSYQLLKGSYIPECFPATTHRTLELISRPRTVVLNHSRPLCDYWHSVASHYSVCVPLRAAY